MQTSVSHNKIGSSDSARSAFDADEPLVRDDDGLVRFGIDGKLRRIRESCRIRSSYKATSR